MPASQETNISSFLIRFVDASQPVSQSDASYRGVIRHIQSGDEIAFTRWAEATDFIQRFFPIAELDPRTLKEG
jgi:hypothetical protein